MPPVYIVADGMGGHRGGNVASSLAMQVMATLSNGGNSQMLADKVRQANSAILERSRADRDLQGMGTTITATYFENGDLHVAQVGDSRAYLLRGGELTQVTTDHTLVNEMVKHGQITAAEAEHHPQRSILTRALGVDEGVEVDDIHIPAEAGDRLLLCSDGLHSMVDDGVIKQVLTEAPDPQSAAERLVDLANEAGGLDNITVVVIEFSEGEGFEGATWVPPAAPGVEAPAPTPELGMDLTSAHPIPAETIATAQSAQAPPAGAPPMPARRRAAMAEGPDLAPPNPAHQAPPQPRRPGGGPGGAGPRPPPPPTPPPRAPPGPGPPGGGGRRILLWAGALIPLLLTAAAGTRLYVDSQYFVGVEDGKVAVFRGLPTKTLGVKVFGLVELTDIPAAQALACKQWAQLLRDGDTASSQADAEKIVAQIRADLAQGGRCGP